MRLVKQMNCSLYSRLSHEHNEDSQLVACGNSLHLLTVRLWESYSGKNGWVDRPHSVM